MSWYKLANNKVLYIMRGPSGSGKSTLARKLTKDGLILSTDDFWMQGNEYKFNPKLLGEAHKWNQERAEKYMSQGISPIIIDNTNLEPWEMKPYVAAAKKYNYEIIIKALPIENTPEELAKRNVHNVPLHAIERMISKYDPNLSIEDIEKSERPQRKI
jgi:NEDD4-binding protein 2